MRSSHHHKHHARRLLCLTALASLAADRFTVADVSVGYALLLATTLKLHGGFGPRVAQYWERLQQREGYQRARVAQRRAAEQAGVKSDGAF